MLTEWDKRDPTYIATNKTFTDIPIHGLNCSVGNNMHRF